MASDLLVKLDVRQHDGCWSAVSEDMHGLHVRGESVEAVRQRAMWAIQALCRFNNQADVEVSPTEHQLVLRVRPR
jgi:predicted RNase H-like HicB family nuclease